MKMKRMLALTLSLVFAGVMLTACGGNKDSSSAEDTTVTTTIEETTTTAETEATTETTVADETTPGDATAPEASTNPLAAFGEAVEKSTEWPSLMEVTDEATLKDGLLLDAKNPNYKAILAKMAMISAASGQYIIIEAVEGKVDEAVKDLEAYKKKLIEQDSFYPKQKEDAEKSIVGKVGNYAYFVVHEEIDTVDKAMKEALGK